MAFLFLFPIIETIFSIFANSNEPSASNIHISHTGLYSDLEAAWNMQYSWVHTKLKCASAEDLHGCVLCYGQARIEHSYSCM